MYAHIFKTSEASRKAWLTRARGGKSSSASEWAKVGSQKGSNPGGVYERDGVRHYVKFPRPGQSLTEEISDRVHEALGAKTMNHEMQMIGDKEASVSVMNSSMEILGRDGWRNLDARQRDQAAKIVVASMLTKNWDVVGLTYDNVAKDSKGDLHIVDTGGSFKFRAQGEPKPFDGSVETEIARMTDYKQYGGEAASVIEPLLKKHPEAFSNAAKALSKMTKADFEKLAGDFNDPSVVQGLLDRQKKLVKHFGGG